eukprot:gene9145-16812_t
MATINWCLPFACRGTLSSEARLVQDLMRNYVKYSKPTINASGTVHLVFGAELVQIVSIQMMPNQVLSTKLWVRMKWKNELLAWNSSAYDDVTSIRLNAIDVWTPDIQLYQEFDPSPSNEKNKDGLLFKTQVMVQNDGTTFWNSPATFTTSCELHLADFPYDTQTCDLKFGPWNSDVSHLNMTTDSLPLTTDKFIESSEWELLSVEKKRNSIKYACCDHVHGQLPSLSILYFVVMIEVAFSALVTCVIVTVHYTSESGDKAPMPLWIEKYLLINGENFLHKIKLLSKTKTLRTFEESSQMQPFPHTFENNFKSLERETGYRKSNSRKNRSKRMEEDENRPSSSVTGTPTLYKNSKGLMWQLSVERTGENPEDSSYLDHLEVSGEHSGYPSSLPQLDGILKQLRIITNRWRSDNVFWEAGFRWCRLAVVLDRLLFIVFSFFTICTLISFTVIRPAIATS